MSSGGSLVISLDFEKYWGMRDKRSLNSYRSNLVNVEKVVSRTLKLFEAYGIRATWSTVGFLFNKSLDQLRTDQPRLKPAYDIDNLDPYQYIDKLDSSAFEEECHFGYKEIEQIKGVPGQEISTHTFSHLYMLERGISGDAIKADLELALQVASNCDIAIRSIVFPRNQYNDQSLEVLKELGVLVYRGNEQSWLYKSNRNEDHGYFRRLLRLLDGFFNISGHHTFEPKYQNGMVNVQSSRFLRPYRSSWKILNDWHLRRVKNSMSHAARRGQVFHLWWHPHNFGSNMEENFDRLEAILRHWSTLNEKYAFKSRNMSDYWPLEG